jgi:hypothetical protein
MNSYGQKPAIGFVEEVPDNAVVVWWTTPTSQSTEMATGFEMDWSFESNRLTMCESNTRVVTMPSGTISDHSTSSGLYTAGMSCQKTITASAGMEITLIFSRMELASSGDCLTVYDSNEADPFQQAAKWCGEMSDNQNPAPGKLVLHSGNAHLVWETYQRTSGAKGFAASWEFTAPSSDSSVPTPMCGGGVLTADTGTLVDMVPGTDDELYYKGMNCRRVIQAPIGSVVRLKVKKWDLPTTYGAGTVTLCRGADVDVGCSSSANSFLAKMNSYGQKPAIGFVEEVPDNAVVVWWTTPTSQSTEMATGFELEWSFDPPCESHHPKTVCCALACCMVWW